MTEPEVLYDGPIVKYEEAKSLGLKYYFTGKPCKRGHIDKRQVSDCSCVKCKKIGKLKYRMDPKNIEKGRECSRRWRKENPEKNAAASRIYSSRKYKAEGNHNSNDVLQILYRQKSKCAEPTCQKDLSEGYHVDHIMPLTLGGSNWPDNLQCLCQSCNCQKNSMHPIDWAMKKGRLL